MPHLRKSDLEREAEEISRLLLAMAGTHPTAAHRLAIDFQDSRHEHDAGRLTPEDYRAELAEIRRRLGTHFASIGVDVTANSYFPLPRAAEKADRHAVRPSHSGPPDPAAAPTRKPSLYT